MLWHDIECSGCDEDLPLWRALAAEAGGPVLDVGAGTGRVSLDLAARGVAVVALDAEASLLEAVQAAFLRRALDHLEPGGLVAAALADAMDCFDQEHDMPPPPDAYEAAGVRLERVTADDVAAQATQVGFHTEPCLSIPETEEYLGSTVVVLSAPMAAR